jgi:uncharacterized protein (DUF4415 family)
MNKKNSKKETKSKVEQKSGTDWERLEAMTDNQIDYTDIPPLDEHFFAHAQIRLPRNKRHITLRLDAEVLEWFQASGKGYQTRINAVLRSFVEAQNRRQAR